MEPIYHFTATLIVAAFTCIRGGTPTTLFLVFFFGFFIDLDHYLTYWIATQSFTLNPATVYWWIERTFFKTSREVDISDYLVLFHEFEVVLFISIILVVIAEPFPLAAHLIHQGMDRMSRKDKDPRSQSLLKHISKFK